ncbi:leucyl/phenylalanyl-tRNA--protein transferase [Marinicella meishanensis]|uniref:leucyl/phenylalanyl-tRNA--protein transferase n=1 Tax=Marinicella meishanensis TaxID=2873263 RepID=UPI001CBE70DF|nr:leucyl/phenylalanyl-tRNA--protein transferase [Marinicella sp. NBU2979]
MILPCIDGDVPFPDVSRALIEPDGLLCFGGDLSIDRLQQAYRLGIFPWYSAGEPLLWWSPRERMVLKPELLHISRSLRKAIQQQQPQYHLNRDFNRVITQCAQVPRKDQGTWIHPEMIEAYCALFAADQAFCLEVELDGQLAGGIYGVKTETIWCGESMFSSLTNGSKMAMVGLCQLLLDNGLPLLDCQLHNPHLQSMGAHLISREAFAQFLP